MEVLGSDIIVLEASCFSWKSSTFVWCENKLKPTASLFVFSLIIIFLLLSSYFLSLPHPSVKKKKKADLTVSWAKWEGLIKVLPDRGYVFPFRSWTLGPDGLEEQGWRVMCPGPRASWGSFMLHRLAEQLSCPLCCWLRSASPGARHGPLPGICQTDSEI